MGKRSSKRAELAGSAEQPPATDGPLPTLPFTPSTNLLGYLGPLQKDPLGVVMMALGKNERLVRLRAGHLSIFILFDPEDIRRVLIDDAEVYGKATRGYDLIRQMLGDGLLSSEGDFWRRQRRIAQPAFRKKCIDGFAKSMVTAAQAQCDAWRAVADGSTTTDVAEAMTLVTLQIAADTLMSADMQREGREVGDAMATVLERFNDQVNSALPWPAYWPTRANRIMWRAIRRLQSITDNLIQERRASGEQVPDLLGMLMAAEDPESGERMDDLQLRAEALTMLAAGHETTANALTWTLYLLTQNPDATAQLEEELDRVLAGRAVSLSDVEALTFTRSVIDESLRLYPPGWMITRRAMRDGALGGSRIPKGSYIFLSPYAMHRHPDYWTDPDTFDPSRFGPEGGDIDRHVYFPFLRGQRQCIGDRFALLEMTLLLATFAQQFRFTLEPGHQPELEPSLTLRPRNGMPMRLTAR